MSGTGQSPKRRGNGTPPPIPQGAVDLSNVGKLVTTHTTVFQGCHVKFFATLDNEGKVDEYMMQIEDPYNKHSYRLSLGPDREQLCKIIMSLPEVGTEGGSGT